MKMKKTVAAILAMSFAISAAGCSKVKSVTGEDVVNVCEDMDFEEFDDPHDINDDSLSDGFYFVADRDYIEDNVIGNVEPYLRMSGMDLGIDLDDVEEATLFGKWDAENIDDVEDPEDLEDVQIDFVFGLQITLEDYDAQTLDDIVDGIDDLLRKINIDMDDLSASEFKQGKSDASLQLGLDIADSMEDFLASDFWEALTDRASSDDEIEEVEEAFSALTGHAGIEILIADGNILILVGGSLNCESELSSDFCSALNVDNPAGFPNSQILTDGIIETFNDYSGLFAMGYDDYEFYDF